MQIVYIFLGSGLGGITRYGISRLLPVTTFPIATLTANILACFILGFIAGFAESKQLLSQNTRLFWTTGFCGGFSTFSTFSQETLSLIKECNHWLALVYIIVSVVSCFVATYTGSILINLINK